MEDVIGSDKRVIYIAVDSDVYSESVCKKAAYALMGHFSCLLSKTDEKTLQLELQVNQDCNLSENALKSLMYDELLDYSLREEISHKTQPMRDLILSNAFSNTKLVG